MDKSKQLARIEVQSQWNRREYELELKGIQIAYQSQKIMANDVHAAYLQGVSLVNLIAPPQWGKTGIVASTAYLMTTHSDDTLMTMPENVYIVTGMSDKEWERQTKERMIPAFRNNVYHRGKFRNGVAERLASVRDAFVIIDECHYGSEKDQTIHTRLKNVGFLDINHLQEHNVKILCISATPGSVLIDAQRWGSQHQRTIVCDMNEPGYVGFKSLIAEKRLRNFTNKKGEFAKMIELVGTRWSEPRWHIIRATPSKEKIILTEIRNAGYISKFHNSNTPISDIDMLLSKPPKAHTFIIIKAFYKAAKTFDDTYIGVCLDSSKDCTMAAQGLAGRMCGHGKKTGSLAPLVFCHLASIESYISWYDNGCDYYQSETYKSANLTVRNGEIKKKKETVVNPSEVDNLVPLDDGGSAYVHKTVAAVVKALPKKIGIVAQADGVQVATTITVYKSSEELASQFNLKVIPNSAKKLTVVLKQAHVKANVSFEPNSIKSVANLRNYYTNKSWAANEYHIIREDDKQSYFVIKRNKEILDTMKTGDRVIAHNHNQELVLYEYE
jgi:hypothetical protein